MADGRLGLVIKGHGVDLVLSPGERAAIDGHGRVRRLPGGRTDHTEPRRGALIHDEEGCWIVDSQADLNVYASTRRVQRLILGRGVELRFGDNPGAPGLWLEPTTVPRAQVEPVEHGRLALEIRGLTVETAGRRRLDGIDLDVPAGSFLAILGTSGAGKSTMVKAITASEPATSGTVRFEGRDLYASFDEVRRRIGYVPQEDILHPQLTVRDTLEFAARLRFPADYPEVARRARVDAVIAQLGLSDRAFARVDELSGGQRKRVNVAVELLTAPSLLILDEPTSGLDPGNERHLMELLRELASDGRTVLVVTHSVESLNLCDRVLFLARGGVPVFIGPPGELPQHVGARSLADVFAVVDSLPDPTVARVPRRSGPLEPPKPPAAPEPSGPMTRLRAYVAEQVRRSDAKETGRQFRILTERYLRVLAADRRNLMILGLQAPLIALLMVAVFGSGHLDLGGAARPEAGNVLMALVLAAIYLGAVNAVREIVKEQAVLRREQNFGLSTLAYLGSKVVVLGALTAAQAVLLVVVGTARQDGPTDGVTLLPGKIELLAVVVVCGLSALCLGLLISAGVNTADKAMTLLPVMLFVQFLMAGLIFPVSAIGIQQLSWLTSARWGFAGAAATADFWTLRDCAALATSADCSVLWKHEVVMWILSYAMLCGLAVATLGAAWWAITRQDAAEALRRRDR